MDERTVLNISTILNGTTSDEDDNEIQVSYENDTNLTRVFLELLTVISLLSALASLLLIYAICKFRKLRQSSRNLLILHISIVHTVYMVCTPLTVRLVIDFALIESISMSIFCVLNEFEGVLIAVLYLQYVLLTADWYLDMYAPTERYAKFQHIYKFLLVVVYLVGAGATVLTTQFCIRFGYMIAVIFIDVLLYVVMLVFVAIMNIVHQVKKRRPGGGGRKPSASIVGLALTNIFVCVWLPVLGCLILTLLCAECTSGVEMIVATALGFLSPLLGVVYLYWRDDDYHIFLRSCAKCQCNSYANGTLLIAAEDTSSVLYNNAGCTSSNEEGAVEIYVRTPSAT